MSPGKQLSSQYPLEFRYYKYYNRAVARNPALQVRLPADAFERLACLRRERHLNVSAWARQALLNALERDFPENSLPPGPAAARVSPESAEHAHAGPYRGWRPARIPDGGWGSACDSPVGLPAELVGLPIKVQPRQGPAWTTTVLEVIQRDDHRVLVRDTGRPARDA
ncbi:MAG: ribbon-helix-helix protein, CopG family [Alphaproteobacteria bacterium]|nr:ribbon-helix-helix protein, CopG family [Alphaproteobacteria bacterium]